MNRRGWIGSSLLRWPWLSRPVSAWPVEVRVHTGNRRGLREPARADGVGDGRRREGARAPPDDDVDRHGPGPALDHPAQRAARHRPPGHAHARADRRGGHRARRARRLRRGGRAEGAGGAGRPGGDDARPHAELASRTVPRPRRRWIGRARSATSRWRRSRAPRRSSPARRSARRSARASASRTCTPAST